MPAFLFLSSFRVGFRLLKTRWAANSVAVPDLNLSSGLAVPETSHSSSACFFREPVFLGGCHVDLTPFALICELGTVEALEKKTRLDQEEWPLDERRSICKTPSKTQKSQKDIK